MFECACFPHPLVNTMEQIMYWAPTVYQIPFILGTNSKENKEPVKLGNKLDKYEIFYKMMSTVEKNKQGWRMLYVWMVVAGKELQF